MEKPESIKDFAAEAAKDAFLSAEEFLESSIDTYERRFSCSLNTSELEKFKMSFWSNFGD